VGVTENDTNLRGGSALPGELGDLLDDLVGGGLEPRGSRAGVGESGGRNALALAVKSTHLVESEVVAATVVMLCAVRVRRGRRFVVKFSRGSRFVWSGKFFAYLGQTPRLCGISQCLCGPHLKCDLQCLTVTCAMDPHEKPPGTLQAFILFCPRFFLPGLRRLCFAQPMICGRGRLGFWLIR
jgi:hypothetical protein